MVLNRFLFFSFFILIYTINAQIIIENHSNRMFVKPFEVITLDVFLDDEYLIYMEDLKESTNYVVRLSYAGVIPVQYDVFLEVDDDDPIPKRSVHKRRIQDTRLFSFVTDDRSHIIKKVVDDNGNETIEHYRPILHVIPRHLAEAVEPENVRDRYVTITIEPATIELTPTIQKAILIIGGLLIIILYSVTFYYQNPSFKHWVNKMLGYVEEKTD